MAHHSDEKTLRILSVSRTRFISTGNILKHERKEKSQKEIEETGSNATYSRV